MAQLQAPFVSETPIMKLESARAAMAAAASKAATLGLSRLSIAVVDHSGALVAFERHTGLPGLTGLVAEAKAATSAFCAMPTSRLSDIETRWPGLTRGLAARLGERFTTCAGGLPVQIEGRIVGAIGISGGTPEQDDLICEDAVVAGLRAEAG